MPGDVDGSIVIGTEIDTSGMQRGLDEATARAGAAAEAIGSAFSAAAEQAQQGLATHLQLIDELTMAYERFAAQAQAMGGAATAGAASEGGGAGASGASGAVAALLDAALASALQKAQELNFAQVGTQVDADIAAGVTEGQAARAAVEQLVAEAKAAAQAAVAAQGFQAAGGQMDIDAAEGVAAETGTLTGAVEAVVAGARAAAGAAVMGADFPGAGRSIPEGMAQGVMGGTGALVSAVQGMVAMALAAARAALDAHSPSRAYETLGNDSVDGYLQPFEARAQQSGDLVGAYMEAMARAAQRGTRVATGDDVRTAAGTGSATVNIGEIAIQTDAINGELDVREIGRMLGEEVAREKRYRGVV